MRAQEANKETEETMSYFGGWRQGWRRLGCLMGLVMTLMLAQETRILAAFQFDVFVGYDGITREMDWFPMFCEVANDGPTFAGVIEFSTGQFGQGQVRRIAMEFPTNTRKRFSVPVFCPGRYMTWNARVLDERGKERASLSNLRAKRDISSKNFLLGAVPRSFGGLPMFPEVRTARPELQPSVSHLRPEFFPDNPICLEGLDALYLNSERAMDLTPAQANAILSWVRQGGHLILGIEQPGDLNGAPWLKTLMPGELNQVVSISAPGVVQDWMRGGAGDSEIYAPFGESITPGQRNAPRSSSGRSAVSVGNPYANLPVDPAFDQGTIALATGTWHDGSVDLSVSQSPLVVRAARGRGKITVLTFSPEREPFRGWKNRAWFWARLAQVPTPLVSSAELNVQGGWSIDGVFGAMIDSKQARKLPVSWLLLILVVYLALIGPVDYYVLKRINRTMLTWVTFPVYVVFFSLLIYFIGYKLRAGETEHNELCIADILPRGAKADVRGRTYFSIYSPANARFPLASDRQFDMLRGEAQGAWGGGEENSRVNLEQQGSGFKANVYVPVWTSQLFVHDWWQYGVNAALGAQFKPQANGWQLTMTNHLNRPLTNLCLIYKNRVYTLGTLQPNEAKVCKSDGRNEQPLADFLTHGSSQFQDAVRERREAFGRDPAARTWEIPQSTMAASFISQITSRGTGPWQFQSTFSGPSSMDMTTLAMRNEPILFAWDPNYIPTSSIRQFEPKRKQRDTLWRMVVPLAAK